MPFRSSRRSRRRRSASIIAAGSRSSWSGAARRLWGATQIPGATLSVPLPEREASFGMTFPDHPRRIFQAGELSDGTLRYLALAGALLALRLPAFIALNEPESSLHPDLLEPLARLIVKASERTQIWLVTHSERLAAALARHGRLQPRTVIKKDGETWSEGLGLAGDFDEEE